jgi:hypothetical protein
MRYIGIFELHHVFPSGLANNCGVIPDAFPAAVGLTGLGALPDAVVSACLPLARQAIDRPVLSLPQTLPLIYVAVLTAGLDSHLITTLTSFSLPKSVHPRSSIGMFSSRGPP